jgi:hypothetical protein
VLWVPRLAWLTVTELSQRDVFSHAPPAPALPAARSLGCVGRAGVDELDADPPTRRLRTAHRDLHLRGWLGRTGDDGRGNDLIARAAAPQRPGRPGLYMAL